MSLVEVLLALAIGVAGLSMFLPFWLRYQIYWEREMQCQREVAAVLSCVSELDWNVALRGGDLSHWLEGRFAWEWNRSGNAAAGFYWQLDIRSKQSELYLRRQWEILAE